MQSLTTLIALLVLTTPLWLLAAGLVPTSWANARPRITARLNGIAAWLALTSAVLVALLYRFEHTYTWS
ncbi:MAG: NADH dehydrogenase FAD-containing subunit, partial [Thiohalophilus sp.]